MRKTFQLLLIILFFISGNPSAQRFFPLQFGNIYQIKNDWYWSGPGGTGGSGTYFKVISVIQDSLINGESFYSISANGNGGPFLPGYLFRYDSLNQKLLVKIPGDDSMKLAADFNIPEDSAYLSYFRGEPVEFISGGISPEVFWGDTLLVYKMESAWTSSSVYNYNFAEGLGLSYFRYRVIDYPSYGSSSEYYTISAIIDSNIFHPLILQIDSLYPAFDRPINTFPYLLSVPYHVSYSQLIDHFYLNLEVERDSNVIFDHYYNISISNPHIQIDPPNLQVGDIIKLKAVISDTSIFNNIDIYPDTGWVTFRVLAPVSVNDDNQFVYKYKLEQNYPNPFNPTTIINYEILKRTFVSIKVYDILGNELATLINEELSAGNYNVEFNAGNLSSGVYICQLRTREFTKTTKMILAK